MKTNNTTYTIKQWVTRGAAMLLPLLTLLLASCMDSGYDDPTDEYTGTTFELNNVMTIQDLKTKFRSNISGSSMKLIEEDIQVKGIVTGNDEGSNLYNEISLQDESGAIIVAISQSGLYGSLPVGAEIAVNLKGLYIGAYGGQAEIGGVYTNAKSGASSIGGMDRYMWRDHYMLISKGSPDNAKNLMTEFDYSKASNSDYVWQNQGKLMRLSNVTFKDGDGKSVFAPKTGVSLSNNSANRGFVGLNNNRVVFRTSTYAKFANDTIPQGKTSVIGIFTVYNSTWQILARSRSDAYGNIE